MGEVGDMPPRPFPAKPGGDLEVCEKEYVSCHSVTVLRCQVSPCMVGEECHIILM